MMHLKKQLLLLLSLGLFVSIAARADVKMPGIFGDHMVLQHGTKIPVWGWADPNEEVLVEFGATKAKTKAGADGKWRVDLEKSEANSEPQTLTVTGKNVLKFEDVLVGDVWVCSGQSNMEFGISAVVKIEDVLDPQIRTFCVTKSAALEPMDNTTFVPKEVGLDTLTGHWQKEDPAGPWGGFSAVGYLFAKEIRRITQKPVGMIGSHWGGTPVEAWTSLSGLEKDHKLANYVNAFKNLNPAQKARYPVVWADYVIAMRKWNDEVWEPDNAALRQWEAAAQKAREAGTTEPPKPQPSGERPNPPGNEGLPSSLFNGMINPLIPYAIKGVIWYQGESNAGNSVDYAILFPNLIRDWREKWGQGDFPFLFMQLAGYETSPSDGTHGRWAFLRESQAEGLKLPNTGMATAMDIGDKADIHPKNKVDVAKRLGLIAENRVYGKKVVDGGPVFSSVKFAGAKARVSFKNAGHGLFIGAPPVLPGVTPNQIPAELIGFEIAGADQKWVVAKATIDGDSIVVSSQDVAAPVAVRYAWADFPTVSLYNKEGLPALPFRTDSWN